MSKFHKKNKTKQRKRRLRQSKNLVDAKNEIIELAFNSKSFEEEAELLETPFGEILVYDKILLDVLKNKNAIFELLEIDNEVEENDTLGRLIYLEKLKAKYPKEPLIAHEISRCYEEMKEWEKYEQTVEENYEKHRGYPSIDIRYVVLNFNEYGVDILDDIFGKTLNIHQAYPTLKAFDDEMVIEFYATLSTIYKERNELLLARQCAEIVTPFDKFRGGILETSIDYIEKPWLKWKSRFIVMIIILVVIGVIGGIIWGIISLFQWVF